MTRFPKIKQNIDHSKSQKSGHLQKGSVKLPPLLPQHKPDKPFTQKVEGYPFLPWVINIRSLPPDHPLLVDDSQESQPLRIYPRRNHLSSVARLPYLRDQ